MKRILIVKVTSLGDVVQAQPVVADLLCAFPGAKIDWAVDEMFADVVRFNAGIDRVLCAPLRRFKRARNWGDLKAIACSIAELRKHRYDVVVDIHGVYKSAIISFLARSRRRIGYRAPDLGERGAAFAYTERFSRPDCDAWHGMRVCTAAALGYRLGGPAVYNLHVPGAQKASPGSPQARNAPVAMLFHATSNEDKKWPPGRWAAVALELLQMGFDVVLPWGTAKERDEAVVIASNAPGATVSLKLSVLQMAKAIDSAALVVGTDTGFVHFAHALGKRTVMIFTATSPGHCGVHVPHRSVSVGDNGRKPSVEEVLRAIGDVCGNPGASQGDIGDVAALIE